MYVTVTVAVSIIKFVRDLLPGALSVPADLLVMIMMPCLQRRTKGLLLELNELMLDMKL